MKTIGIDIGTTTISGVILEKRDAEKAKILEVKTIENGSFLTTENDWEKIQDAEKIRKKHGFQTFVPEWKLLEPIETAP